MKRAIAIALVPRTMRRIIVVMTAVALCSGTAAAQVATNGAANGRGSTGPTFPNPGPNPGSDTLIATAPAPVGVNVGTVGQPAPDGVDSDPATAAPGPAGRTSGGPDPTRR